MARIRIDIPVGKVLATINLAVRITDINYGNHLGNDALVGLLHEARIQWLKAHNYSELDVDGASLIMSDLGIEYKNESFYGDELTVIISAGEISKAGFELFYELRVSRDGLNSLIAKAKTGMVCYDYSNRKIKLVPEGLRKLLNALTA